MAPIKKYLERLGLLIIGLILAFSLAEVLVRMFYPDSRDHVIPTGFFEMENDLGWKLRHQQKRTHHSRYLDVVYTTNALGYRDQERTISRGESLHRILLYGDSQIFGWGIRAEERFSNLLEAQTTTLQLWNLAVPGYGLDQQILSYERDGDRFDVDEVIFFVSKNTVARNRYSYIYKKYKPIFIVDSAGQLQLIPLPTGKNNFLTFAYRMLSPFYLPYFLERRFAHLQAGFSKSPKTSMQQPERETRVFHALDRGLIARVKVLCDARGHLLTILANLDETDTRTLSDLCKKIGADFVNAGLPRTDDSLTIGPRDRHWNARAHQIMAKKIASLLEQRR